jgi:hypothetical protein
VQLCHAPQLGITQNTHVTTVSLGSVDSSILHAFSCLHPALLAAVACRMTAFLAHKRRTVTEVAEKVRSTKPVWPIPAIVMVRCPCMCEWAG